MMMKHDDMVWEVKEAAAVVKQSPEYFGIALAKPGRLRLEHNVKIENWKKESFIFKFKQGINFNIQDIPPQNL